MKGKEYSSGKFHLKEWKNVHFILYGKNKYGLYSLKSKFAISTEALPLALLLFARKYIIVGVAHSSLSPVVVCVSDIFLLSHSLKFVSDRSRKHSLLKLIKIFVLQWTVDWNTLILWLLMTINISPSLLWHFKSLRCWKFILFHQHQNLVNREVLVMTLQRIEEAESSF